MKKQFLKFTALLLSGAMLLNVGCTDYDDDIRDIQSQIDNLTSVTIADLQTQLTNANSAISGINKTIEELQAADKANASLIAQLRQDMEKADGENAKAIKDAITYLEGLSKKNADAITALQTSLGNLSDKVTALENTHKQDIKSVKDLYQSLSKALDDYKTAQALTDKAQDGKIQALDNRLTALDKTGGEIDLLKGRVKTLEDADLINRMTTVEGILGADLAKVLKDAGYSSVSAVISEYVTVKADVDDLKNNFNSKVDAAIASASDEGNHYKITNVADLKSAIQDLHSGIEAANNKIAALQKDLASQVQSIVSVPEYTDGSFDLQVYTVDGKVVGNSVKLVYQITPAAIAETVVAAGIDAIDLVVKEAKTRAAAPSAQINSIKAGAEAGTIEVMATILDYPTDAAVNVALKFKNKVRDDKDSVLENDVISDYAGVIAVEAADYKAITFEVEGTKEYKVAWNTPKAESLRTIFDDADVVAKVDGKKYELSALKEFVGVEFGSVQYKVSTTATPASGVFTVKNEAKSFAKFPDKAITVEFAKDLEYTNVGNKVAAAAQFRVKVGAAYANPVAVNATYTVCNAQGATFVFGTLQKPWDYKWLISAQTDLGGYYDLQPRPAIPAADLAGNQLGEVAVSVEGEEPFQPALFERIVNAGVCVKNKVDNKAIPVNVSAKASEVALIALVSFDEATYEWGKTYNVEYVYTYENVDYIVKGTVALGAAPANIKKEIAVPMGWADATATVKLADLYAEHPAGFADAAEFQSAVLQKGMDASNNGSNALLAEPATTNYRYNAATKKYNAAINGTVAALTINPAIAVAPAATPAGAISGKIGKDAIEKDGDSFRQTWTMTTWYGQKIEIVATYDVVLPASSVFEMLAKDIYIKDGKATAEGYIGTDAATGNAVWTVETKEEIGNYIDWKNGGLTDLDIYFKKLSVDNNRQQGTLGKFFANVNVNDTNNPKIEWTNNVTTEREVEVLAYIGLGARKINVAESKFTVVTPDPIVTFEHSNLETAYQINEVGDKSINVNLLEGMSIIDADRTPNQWIVAKDDNAGTPAQLATAKGTFSTVFATKSLGGYVYVNGINFKITDNDQLEGVEITNDGHLNYVPVGGSTLQRDVNVKVEAHIKYWLGEKTVNFTVTIKK